MNPRNLIPWTQEKQLGIGDCTPQGIDNIRFVAAVARILARPKELKGPYEACIAIYGSKADAEQVVVSIVDMKRRLVIDHRTWLISEYGNEVSRSVEAAMTALTDDMMDYCERSRVGRIFLIDKPFPLQALEERCSHCGERRVAAPWQE